MKIGVGFLIGLWAWPQVAVVFIEAVHDQAVELGYGEICADTDRFAWKGECHD